MPALVPTLDDGDRVGFRVVERQALHCIEDLARLPDVPTWRFRALVEGLVEVAVAAGVVASWTESVAAGVVAADAVVLGALRGRYHGVARSFNGLAEPRPKRGGKGTVDGDSIAPPAPDGAGDAP